jgi:enoyl-CoA hydratase/carnithine racemase
MSRFESYRDRYRFVRLERQERILQVTIHRNGESAQWSAFPGGIHEELGDAFYEIGRDEENLVVILTGAGDIFLAEFDYSEPDPQIGTVAFWDRIYREGRDLLSNFLNINVPVVAAVNGPAFIHAEIPTMADLVLASDKARFADKAHFPQATVPGDGVHVWWPMLLGPNRGRQFLLTGEEIDAQEAKALGFVAEVVPHDALISRAWDIARELARKPERTLRYTRIAFTQHIKRRMFDDLGYGLQLEGLAALDSFEKRRQAQQGS